MSYRIEKKGKITYFIGEGIDKGKSFATTKSGKAAVERFNSILKSKGEQADIKEQQQVAASPPSTQNYIQDTQAQQTRPISPYEAQSIQDQQKEQQEQQASGVIQAIENPETRQPGVSYVQEVKYTPYQKAEKKVQETIFQGKQPYVVEKDGQKYTAMLKPSEVQGNKIIADRSVTLQKYNPIAFEIQKRVTTQPIATGITFASGAVLSGVSSGIGVGVKATSRTGKVLTYSGALATGVYGGVKTYQFANAPTFEAKERVAGGLLYETAVFGAGAKVGSKIGTSVGYKIKVSNFDRSIAKWEKLLVGKGETFDINKNRGFIDYSVKGQPRQTQLKPTTESGFDIYTRYETQYTMKQPDYLRQTSLYRFNPQVYPKPLKPTQIFIRPTTYSTQTTLTPYTKQGTVEIFFSGTTKSVKINVDSSFWKGISTNKQIPFTAATQVEKPSSIFGYEDIWGSSTPSGLKKTPSTFSGASIKIDQTSKPFFAPLYSPSTKSRVSTSFSQLATPSQKSVQQLRLEPVSKPIAETSTILIQEPVSKPIQIAKPKQIQEQKQRQIQIPISKPISIPTSYSPTPMKLSKPSFSSPKNTPQNFGGFSFPFLRKQSLNIKSLSRKSYSINTKYKPTVYSASLSIKGTPLNKATRTGLSIRPVPYSDKELKKKARLRL